MVQVIWTEPALGDLRDVHDTIARDSPRNAQRMTDRILQTTRRLESFPLSGRTVPELRGHDYREVLEHPYRIVYRFEPDDERLFIMAVRHGRRRMTAPEL